MCVRVYFYPRNKAYWDDVHTSRTPKNIHVGHESTVCAQHKQAILVMWCVCVCVCELKSVRTRVHCSELVTLSVVGACVTGHVWPKHTHAHTFDTTICVLYLSVCIAIIALLLLVDRTRFAQLGTRVNDGDEK